MTYDFDALITRRGTECVKWDACPDSETIPMWVADMDFATAPCVQRAIAERAQHGAFGYTLVPESFYQSIIDWNARRHGWRPQREWMLYTSGVVPAVSAIIKAIKGAGDTVCTLTPAYNCFFSSIRNNGCRLVEEPLRWHPATGAYDIDFDHLATVLADERVTIFLLCNPHNPSGRVWRRDELERIAAICAEHGVAVLSDEIHCEFVRPDLGRPYLPFAPIAAEAGCDWVVANAPNKAFNTAGLQTAYIVCPDATRRAAIDRAINDNEVCDINVFSHVALRAAYTAEGEEWLDQLVAYIYEGYSRFRQMMAEALPQLPVADLEGTYLPWVDVSSVTTATSALAQSIRKHHHVWVNGGEMYGQAGFLRVNIACPHALMEEGTRRLIAGLREAMAKG